MKLTTVIISKNALPTSSEQNVELLTHLKHKFINKHKSYSDEAQSEDLLSYLKIHVS